MRSQVPLTYLVAGRRKGSREMERVLCSDWHEVGIAEADPRDVQPVASWTEIPGGDQYDGDGFFENGDRVDVCLVNDQHYRRRRDEGRSPPNVADLRVAPLTVRGMPESRLLDSWVPTGTEPYFRSVVLNNRDRAIKALDQKAETLLSVDGEIWERCPEPCLVVEEDERYQVITISPGFPAEGTGRCLLFHFNLDEFEEARVFALGRIATLGWEADALRVFVNLSGTERIPARDHLRHDIRSYAAGFLEETGQVTLNRCGAGFARAWGALANAVEELRTDERDASVDNVISCWSDLIEAEDALGNRTEDRPRGDRGRLEALESRWQRRGIRLDFGTSDAGPR